MKSPRHIAATVALALASAVSTSAHASANSPEDEAIYRQRLAAFISDPGNFDYSPMEPLNGARKYRPLPTALTNAFSADVLARADAYAESMKSSAMIVWHAGAIDHAWYAPGIDRNTPLVSKSLSKPLTAIAVGRAIALGKIKSLDQPISDFIPEMKDGAKGRILLRHLLDMRSGMLDQGYSTDPQHPYNRAFLDTDFGDHIVHDYPMKGEPGTFYSYANAPADLVAVVLERATGRRFVEFVSTEVLKPLGAEGGTIWVGKSGGLAHSGCCAKLPAETFLRLAILLLQDGKWQGRKLLPDGYVTQMKTGTPQNPNFGLGIWIGSPYKERRGFGAPGTMGPQVLHSQPYLDPDIFLFDGNSNQTVHISPANQMIVLRMGASPPAPAKNGGVEWDNSFLPNLLIADLKRKAKAR